MQQLIPWIKYAVHSRFMRDILVVGGGTAAAQIITILFLPIISRLYTPEMFGYYSLLVTSTMLLVPLATWRYDAMIQIAKTNRAAGQLFWLSISSSAIMGALVLSAAFLFRQQLEQWLGLQGVPHWWLFIPAIMVMTATHDTMRAWLLRQRAFSAMAISPITRSTLFSVLASIAPAFSKGAASVGNLTTAYTVAEFARNGVLLWALRAPDAAKLGRFRLRYIYAMARRYANTTIALLATTFVVMIYERLPYFMLGAHFGAAALGYYSMVERIMSAASQLVSGAIGDVYKQRAAESLHNSGDFRNLTRLTITMTSLVAVVPFSLAVIFAPIFFTAVLGPAWKPAGEVASIMLIGEFFAFVVNPIASAIVLVGAAKYLLVINMVRLLLTLALFPMLLFMNLTVLDFLKLLVAIRIAIVLTEGGVAYLSSIKGKPIFQ
jgi:O-antigen/teichoic acid export membrane protein